MTLRGKTAIVTGANSGLDRSTAAAGFARPTSAFITGQVTAVDGGWAAQ